MFSTFGFFASRITESVGGPDYASLANENSHQIIFYNLLKYCAGPHDLFSPNPWICILKLLVLLTLKYSQGDREIHDYDHQKNSNHRQAVV